MNSAQYQLPDPVGKLLSLLPVFPGSVLFVAGLNLALTPHLQGDVLLPLQQKRLRLKVLDAQLVFNFTWQQQAFSATRHTGEADLTIGASAHDFLLLAQRREDPDTLFFSRRLVMEGDTELGLLVKNTLDAIDLSVFDHANLMPARLLARLRPGTRSVREMP
jgi:O2-independent ubiquinone biosynthesis accessory factor UbiT